MKQTIVACGAGASTKIYDSNLKQVKRIENVKDVTQYIERIGKMIERKHVLFNKSLIMHQAITDTPAL